MALTVALGLRTIGTPTLVESYMFPQQVFPDTTAVNERGHLVIGGCDVTELVLRHGTPLYIFDEDTLRERCRRFVQDFGRLHADTQVIYACKAYVNPALARLLLEEGLGLDVVSGGEAAIARTVGFPPERVYFHGNNKGRQELEEAVSWGIGRVVVDNFHELSLLQEVASGLGKTQDIMLRVSPSVDPHTHVYTTTGVLDSKFGFSIETGQAQQAVRQALSSPNLRVVGLHYHLGSPIFEVEPYQHAMGIVLRLAADFREEGLNLEEISPGGGFAIAYTREHQPPSVAEYAEAIVGSMKETCQTLGLRVPRLTIEPGRSVMGTAGVAVYSVGAVKDIPGIRKYVSVDGGMGDNIRPALYEAQYEALVANKADQQASEQVTIAGKYCESGDVLVRDVELPPLTQGDLIAIPASGAYCPSMASVYNLNGRPPIVLVKDGADRLIRRRETYADLMLCDVV